jgi:2-methylcitrate synthase
MKAAMDKMVAHCGRTELLELESAMDEAKNIKPNLDYPAGPIHYLTGFDRPTLTPLFVAARLTGWTAHIMEQAAANSLRRPLSAYDARQERSLTP